MDFIRDPLWQFIGVIFAFISIFLSVMFYLKQRNRKALFYEVVSIAPIVAINAGFEGVVQVLLNGIPVNDAHLVVLEIWNAGNTPISVSDFENNNPIKINFGKYAKIISASVLGSDPEDLKPILKHDERNISLEPLLLNPKDIITFRVLVSNFNGNVKFFSRIKGIEKIIKIDKRDKKSLYEELVNTYHIHPAMIIGSMILLIVLILLTTIAINR